MVKRKVERQSVGKKHTNCDDVYCVRQATDKSTVKNRDEIVYKHDKKYVCSVPVGHWRDVLEERVQAKSRERRGLQKIIKKIEVDCVDKYGRSFERESIQPNVPRESLLTPMTRLPGAIYPNPSLQKCLAQALPYYKQLLDVADKQIPLDDDLRNYDRYVRTEALSQLVGELDLPTVSKKKLKVLVNPKTRRLEYPKVLLAQQKLEIFRETWMDIPACRNKIKTD